LGNVADVLELHPLAEKFRSFRWDVEEIDGHDVDQIAAALLPHRAADAPPLAVVARTVKGKGVDFMEHQLKYHYSPPRTEQQLREVLRQLQERGQ
ncbi:MAG: transketolase, partial [Planctomycetaceae bacterium]